LWTWGLNTTAQLGDSTTINRSSPVQTIASGFNWISVSAATIAMAALRDFATDYLYIPSLSPATQTVSGAVGSAIASTTAYTAIYFSGTISYSISPALPAGLSINSSTGVVSGTPTAIADPKNYTVTAVGSLGSNATATIRIGVGSAVGGMGRKQFGGLGDNSAIQRNSPVQTISGTTTWATLSVGSNYSSAIKNDGTLWSWGRNYFATLGDNTTINRSSPVQTIAGTSTWSSVAAGSGTTGAIKTDGTLWMWGDNGNGQLGDSSFSAKSSPVQTIASGNNWAKVVVAGYQTGATTAALKNDGTLWTWGRNSYGTLGDNTLISRSSPIQTIASGTTWNKLAIGTFHVVATKTDGTLWLWGQGTSGELGDNTLITKSSPIQTIASGTNWNQVAAGYKFTVCTKTDGTLWTWGNNSWGQLANNGYGSSEGKSSPIQTITGGSNWSNVSAGFTTVGAIKTDGTLWTWGLNSYGQVGNNTSGPLRYSSPIQTISGGSNWKQVSVGYNIVGAIKS
jgi:alpha-tubulin suppressor-like RCC1 family protein